MKIIILLFFLLVSSLFLELLIISFPLTFLFTYTIFSIESRFRILIPTAIISMIGDAIFNHPIGVTVFFVCISISAVYLYSRFLGSKDVLVYALIGMTGIFIYAIILSYSVQSLFNWLICAFGIFIIYKIFPRKYLSL